MVLLWLGGNACRAEGAWNLRDPLMVLPPVLASGFHLPGDRQAIDCTTFVDLTEPLSLDRAVDVALCREPQLKSAWAAIRIQSGAVGEAGAAFLPTLRGSLGELRNRTAYPDGGAADRSDRGRTSQWSLGFRLFDFGTRAANRDAAQHLLSAALASHDAALQQILSVVISAYFDAVTAHAVLAAARETGESAVRTGEAVRRRASMGVAAASDALQADVATAKAELGLSRARGDMGKAMATLRHALGAPADISIELPAVMELPAEIRIEDLPAWLAGARETHPAILAARQKLQAAKARLVSVEADGLPTLDFAANHYLNGYPNQGLPATRTNVTTVGVTLSLPLFEGFGTTYRVMGAQAQVEQSAAELQASENRVLFEMVKAHAEAQAAIDNVAASEKLLEAATAATDSARRRYSRGVADVLELLSAQAASADARMERIRVIARWRSAGLQLLATSGRLGSGPTHPQP